MLRKTLSLIIVACISLLYSTTFAQRVCVLYIGDSITDGGWGRSNGMPKPSDQRNHTDLNHIYGHSFMMLCAAQYEADYPEAGYIFFNRGISGNTLNDLSSRWRTDAMNLHPDVVSILIGANDVQEHLNKKKKNPQATFDLNKWADTYRMLLDSLKAQNPEVKIILCTPFVAKAGKIGKEKTFNEREELTAILAKQTKEIANDYNALIVDFHHLFNNLTKKHTNDTYWIWDGIHPTPAGHAKMAELWRKKVRLEKLIKTQR